MSVRDMLRILIVDIGYEWVSGGFQASDLRVEGLWLVWDPVLLIGLRVVQAEHSARGVTHTLVVGFGCLKGEIVAWHP